jgi:hypothetical protein
MDSLQQHILRKISSIRAPLPVFTDFPSRECRIAPHRKYALVIQSSSHSTYSVRYGALQILRFCPEADAAMIVSGARAPE